MMTPISSQQCWAPVAHGRCCRALYKLSFAQLNKVWASGETGSSFPETSINLTSRINLYFVRCRLWHAARDTTPGLVKLRVGGSFVAQLPRPRIGLVGAIRTSE
jgi:hypothetical protein